MRLFTDLYTFTDNSITPLGIASLEVGDVDLKKAIEVIPASFGQRFPNAHHPFASIKGLLYKNKKYYRAMSGQQTKSLRTGGGMNVTRLSRLLHSEMNSKVAIISDILGDCNISMINNSSIHKDARATLYNDIFGSLVVVKDAEQDFYIEFPQLYIHYNTEWNMIAIRTEVAPISADQISIPICSLHNLRSLYKDTDSLFMKAPECIDNDFWGLIKSMYEVSDSAKHLNNVSTNQFLSPQNMALLTLLRTATYDQNLLEPHFRPEFRCLTKTLHLMKDDELELFADKLDVLKRISGNTVTNAEVEQHKSAILFFIKKAMELNPNFSIYAPEIGHFMDSYYNFKQLKEEICDSNPTICVEESDPPISKLGKTS